MGGKRKLAGSASAPHTPSKKPKVVPKIPAQTFKIGSLDSSKKITGEGIQVDVCVESFPRGGQQTLTPLEKSIIRSQAKQDVLFTEEPTREETLRKKKDTHSTKVKKSESKTGLKRLDILTYKKKVVPGMLLLGAVLEVNKFHVTFSLPFNLRGIVAISDVSDHVTKLVKSETQSPLGEENDDEALDSDVPTMERLFSVGQLLPCYVQAIKGSLANLSVNPYLVNSHLVAGDIKPKLLLLGFIKSIEDHGYIVDFGIKGKSGFLLKKNAAEFVKTYRRGKALCVGQVLQCLVLMGTDTKAVPITINPSQASVAMMRKDEMIGMKSLLPGILVRAAVKQVAPNGLLVSFLDGFDGVIAMQHLSTPSNHSLEEYQGGKKVVARLLWVDVLVKSVGLTLRERLVQGKGYDFQGVEIGDKYDASKVIHVDHSSGLYLELGNDIVGYAPSWMITDEERSSQFVPIKDRKKYCKGSLHSARVVQFNFIDGVAIVSLQDSVLDKLYMKYSDLKVGEYVEGVVERVAEFGMTVAISESIHGLCPRIHVSDLKTIIAKPEKKFKAGVKVKCRVLNIIPEKKSLLLTCKRTLIALMRKEDEGEGEEGSQWILCDYSSVRPGDFYTGVVTSLPAYGCIVHFFNRVRGLVRKEELSSTRVISDPSAVFWKGQPVECRVLQCDPDKERLLLSFQLNVHKAGQVEASTMLEPCAIVDTEETVAVAVATAHEKLGDGDNVPEAASDGVMTIKSATDSSLSERTGSITDLKVGDIVSVIVVKICPNQMKVKYRLWKGRVHCTFARDEVEEQDDEVVSSNLSSKSLTKLRRGVFYGRSPGESMTARVIKIRECQILGQASKKGATISSLELTTKQSLLAPEVELDPVSLFRKKWIEGESVSAVISKVTPKGIHVLLTPQVHGFIPAICVSKDVKVLKCLKRYYAEGQVVKCVVLKEKKKLIFDLSMIGPLDALSEGAMTVGHVSGVIAGKCLLMITPQGRGHLDITDMSDHYSEDPFQVLTGDSKFVQCWVVKEKDNKNMVYLSLRTSRMGVVEGGTKVKVRDPEITCLEDVEEGKVVRGYVKAVTDVGVFVRLGRTLDGRVQITHLRDGFCKDFKSLYSVGDLVSAKVIGNGKKPYLSSRRRQVMANKVDRVKGKVELSLRLSLVDPEAAKKKRLKEVKRKKMKQEQMEREKLNSDGQSVEEEVEAEEDGHCVDCVERESSNTDDELLSDEDISDHVARPTLTLSGAGFRWMVADQEAGNVSKDEECGESSSEEEEDMETVETTSKKSRRQKKAAKRTEEVELYRKERSLLETGKEPESAEDFDRLLLATPDQSSLWIQYMAFYLNTAEVDKARSIAQRALRTISFREESEKLNVWVASMNLENLYGTSECLAEVFESALEKNEPVEVYKRLATIYETSKKFELANRLYLTMTKKFGSQQWVWAKYAMFLMKHKKLDQARTLLQRSLKRLPSKQQHVMMISKMSALEYRYGDPERGRTMFESLLSTYPRKVDLWSVYIDIIIKTKEFTRVRELFERVIHLKVSPKNMKFFYKKYLQFEIDHGSQALANAVVEKARAFVESSSSYQHL